MAFACIIVGVDELLLATPHSNLGQHLCACLVGWYPPSRGVWKQLLLGTPHLKVQGGGGSKDLEYERACLGAVTTRRHVQQS